MCVGGWVGVCEHGVGIYRVTFRVFSHDKNRKKSYDLFQMRTSHYFK